MPILQLAEPQEGHFQDETCGSSSSKSASPQYFVDLLKEFYARNKVHNNIQDLYIDI